MVHNHVLYTAKHPWIKVFFTLCILAMIISNGVWLSVYRHQKRVHGNISICSLIVNDFYDWLCLPKLPKNTMYSLPMRWAHHTSTVILRKWTIFGQTFSLVRNTLFSSYFGNSCCLTCRDRPGGGGAVKVDSQWVLDNNLQDTQGYSADNKAIYVVAMYHQLHCVVSHPLKEPSKFCPKSNGDQDCYPYQPLSTIQWTQAAWQLGSYYSLHWYDTTGYTMPSWPNSWRGWGESWVSGLRST